MVGLLDIAPSNRTIETSFGKVDVVGLSLNSVVMIVKRHPQLLDIFQKEGFEVDFNSILDLGLEVVSSLLAAGLGYAGNEEAEKRCRELKPEDAYDIGQAIIEESFPKGAKSFFDKVLKTLEKVNLKQEVVSTKTSLSTSDGLVKS